MDYDRNDLPIERDDPPSDHITFSDGVSRGEVNAPVYKDLRAKNILRAATATHFRQSRTS